MFLRHLEIARKNHLPVIIHNREAGDDILDILKHNIPEESVVLLSDKVDGHIDIKLDVEDLGLKAKGATYPDIKAYVKDKYGLNVSSLYIAQVKAKLGIKERKNYNVGADKTVVPNCPQEKAEAIMDAFRHFNMV